MDKKIEVNDIDKFVKESEITEYKSNIRSFNYSMNEKIARNKLIKGAKRISFEVIKNSTSCNLIFNLGSWSNVVLPSLSYWNEIKRDKTCTIGGDTI